MSSYLTSWARVAAGQIDQEIFNVVIRFSTAQTGEVAEQNI